MGIEAKKLSIIDRLMKVRKEDVINQYEELLIKEELYSRTEESIQAINKGEVVNLDDFKKSNLEWLKTQSTKL